MGWTTARMGTSTRITFLFLLGIFGSFLLSAVTALTAAVSLAATALIVPGTGTPDANIVDLYRQHATDRYIAPFNPSCTSTNGCYLDGIDYPASFFPLGFIGNWCPGYSCDTWDASVGTGVENTYSALQNLTDPDGAILFGYSQGGAVVSDTLRKLQGDPLLDKVKSVVLIGNAFNPDGGFFTRLGFLPTIPLLNITFGPATPVDTGIPMTSIGFEYDPVMYAPKYWGNPFSVLNAVAAAETVHGNYLTPNGNGPMDPIAYGYTEPELAAILATSCPGANCRVDSFGNKYYMIPAKSLPIMDLITSAVPAPLRPVVKPVVDLVSPVYKVLADLGYDWSSDPGKTQFLSILPFNPIQDWPAVGMHLQTATIQGIQALIGDLGVITSVISPPTTTTPVTTLAAAKMTAPTEKAVEAENSTTKLTVVKDEDTAEVKTDAVQHKKESVDPSTEVVKDATSKPEKTSKSEVPTTPDQTRPSGTPVDDKKDADTGRKTAAGKRTGTHTKPAAGKKTGVGTKPAAGGKHSAKTAA